MTEPLITHVHAWEALDSRGRPTVACRVATSNGAQGRAVVPSGASRGEHEALERRDGGHRYGGWGVRAAVDAVNAIYGPMITGLPVSDREAIDALVEERDGDPRLGTYGSNAALSVSLAVTIAGAESRNEQLWQTLANGGGPALIPLPMVNIFSGGAHAGRAVDVQDFLAVPHGAESFAQAIEWVDRVRHQCAELLDTAGGWSALVADEGGLSARLASNDAVLTLLAQGIDRAGFAHDEMGIALDIAASQLADGDDIVLDGEGKRLSADEWVDRLIEWTGLYPIVSIEDALGENDWEGWRRAAERMPDIQLLGDDLFATDAVRLDRGIAERSANAILVKVNQAGSVSRAERVLERAKVAGFATIVSARSGDTEDYWLADLAVGWRSGQIKVGSTMRSERTSKWNRLLEIESEGGTEFAGRQALASGISSVRGSNRD